MCCTFQSPIFDVHVLREPLEISLLCLIPYIARDSKNGAFVLASMCCVLNIHLRLFVRPSRPRYSFWKNSIIFFSYADSLQIAFHWLQSCEFSIKSDQSLLRIFCITNDNDPRLFGFISQTLRFRIVFIRSLSLPRMLLGVFTNPSNHAKPTFPSLLYCSSLFLFLWDSPESWSRPLFPRVHALQCNMALARGSRETGKIHPVK